MIEPGDMNELVKFFEKEGLPNMAKAVQQVIDMKAESQPSENKPEWGWCDKHGGYVDGCLRCAESQPTERLRPPIPPKHPLVKAVETDGLYSVVPVGPAESASKLPTEEQIYRLIEREADKRIVAVLEGLYDKANDNARRDKTMVGAERLRAYHWQAAIDAEIERRKGERI